MLILQCDLCFFLKRHREIAVKSSAWHDCHRHRIYDTFSSESAAEEITKRAFYRWIFFIIPVHTNHQIPQHKAVCICCLIVHCDPDMVDFSRTFHLCQSHSCARFNISQTGTSFSGWSQMARCHSTLSFFSMRVLCIDCTASAMLCQCDTAKSTCK